MPGAFPRTGGVFRTPSHVWARAGGLWRDVQTAYIRSGGVWRPTFSRAAVAQLGNHALNEGNATAEVTFTNDGTLHLVQSTNFTVTAEWLATSPGTVSSAVAGLYDVLFTKTAGGSSGSVHVGGAIQNGTFGVQMNLATSRSFGLNAFAGDISGTGGGSMTVVVQIFNAGTATQVATGTFTFSVSI